MQIKVSEFSSELMSKALEIINIFPEDQRKSINLSDIQNKISIDYGYTDKGPMVNLNLNLVLNK